MYSFTRTWLLLLASNSFRRFYAFGLKGMMEYYDLNKPTFTAQVKRLRFQWELQSRLFTEVCPPYSHSDYAIHALIAKMSKLVAATSVLLRALPNKSQSCTLMQFAVRIKASDGAIGEIRWRQNAQPKRKQKQKTADFRMLQKLSCRSAAPNTFHTIKKLRFAQSLHRYSSNPHSGIRR